tara:strand:+ start:581 stop:841 length:261 start_codon:yes stop_codon:yes gene_type:complete
MDDTLQKWYDKKEQIKKLTKDCERYKKRVDTYMKEHDLHTLDCMKHKVVKKKITSNRIIKKNIPENIWEKFSTETSYTSLYLSLKK